MVKKVQDLSEELNRSVSSARAAREEIQQEIAEYLDAGGVITVVPPGVSGEEGPVSYRELNRRIWYDKKEKLKEDL